MSRQAQENKGFQKACKDFLAMQPKIQNTDTATPPLEDSMAALRGEARPRGCPPAAEGRLGRGGREAAGRAPPGRRLSGVL